MTEIIGSLGIWENLILIFGNPYIFAAVLFTMFCYYGAIADLNKWTMLGFLGVFFIWIGWMINPLIAFVITMVISVLMIEVIRRLGKG